MKQFPEIILPKKLYDFNSNYKEIIEQNLIDKIEKPQKPIKPEELKKPEEPQKFGLYLFFSPLFFTVFVYIMSKYNFLYTSLTYFAILGFILYGFFINKKDYNKSIIEFKNNQLLFPKLLTEYETETKNYERKYKDYEAQKAEVKKQLDIPNFLNKERIEYIFEKKLLNSIRPHKDYINSNKGKSEELFYSYLNKYFCDEILTDKVIEIFQYQNNDYDYYGKNENAYVPDFIFAHKKTKLTINIEIDEPYYQDKPIHCSYEPHDEKRNNYFTKYGLIVVRFSEEQIKNDSIGCCVELASLIQYFTNDSTYLSKLKNNKRVYNHKKWTRKESEYLIKINFRNLNNTKMEDLLKNFI